MLDAFTEAASDAVGRAIASMQREAQQNERVREAEFRARMAEFDTAEAERREAHAAAMAGITHGRDGADGKDADPALVRTLIAEAVAALPPAKDGEPGRDANAAEIAALLIPEVEKAVANLPKPRDGKDADPEVTALLVSEEVEKAFASLPPPKDGAPGLNGKDASPEEIAALVLSRIAIPKDGADGRDGVGLAGAIIDRDGNLVLSLTDGSTRALGAVVGKDGQTGEKGADGLPGEKGESGKDGENGRDAPVPVHRGTYDAAVEYRHLNITMHNGSSWLALKDDPGPLELPDGKIGEGWRLMAQRGGRGKPGERGDPGREGLPGKEGKAGVAVVDFKVNAEDFTISLSLNDGREIVRSARPLFEAYHEQAR